MIKRCNTVNQARKHLRRGYVVASSTGRVHPAPIPAYGMGGLVAAGDAASIKQAYRQGLIRVGPSLRRWIENLA